MAVRTAEQFVDAIDADLAWRKFELSVWTSTINRAPAAQKDAIVRGAWALLYSHWEGFVKYACTQFLEHVESQKLNIGQLSDPLVAVALRTHLSAAASATNGSMHTQLVSAIRAQSLRANVPHDKATIKTHSNLKFEVFQEILWSIGCEPADFDDLRDFLDPVLLKHRNDIAHGKYLLVNSDLWSSLRDRIVIAMDGLRTQVQNAAVLRTYRMLPIEPAV